MHWVVPHSLAQTDSRVQQRVWSTAHLAAVQYIGIYILVKKITSCTLEALQMNFTFCNSNNNNPPARTTAQEAAEQKLNILLEWPNV